MYRWTVIYIVSCDSNNDQLTAASQMFGDILQSRISDQVAVIICLHMATADVHLIDPTYMPSATAGDNITLFYKIDPLPAPVSGKNSKLTLIASENSSFDITQKASIQQYFQQRVLQGGFAASQYALITWGHGAAYGIYYEGTPPMTIPSKWDMLSMDDLKDAILGAFGSSGNQRINVILMMNCYMQLFDTGFAMHAAQADYLICPEAGVDFFGYNYAAIFDQLFGTPAPGMSPLALATLVVTSLNDPAFAASQQANLNNLALYANDLSVYTAMATAMNDLGDALITELTTNSAQILAAGRSCINNYVNALYNLVDFFGFVDALKTTLGATWQPNVMNTIQTLQAQIVTARYLGKSLQTPAKKNFALGFSVCLPTISDNKFYLTYEDPASRFSTFFATSSGWSRFIKAYVKYLRPAGGVTFSKKGMRSLPRVKGSPGK